MEIVGLIGGGGGGVTGGAGGGVKGDNDDVVGWWRHLNYFPYLDRLKEKKKKKIFFCCCCFSFCFLSINATGKIFSSPGKKIKWRTTKN